MPFMPLPIIELCVGLQYYFFGIKINEYRLDWIIKWEINHILII